MQQGASKETRTLALHFGESPPSGGRQDPGLGPRRLGRRRGSGPGRRCERGRGGRRRSTSTSRSAAPTTSRRAIATLHGRRRGAERADGRAPTRPRRRASRCSIAATPPRFACEGSGRRGRRRRDRPEGWRHGRLGWLLARTALLQAGKDAAVRLFTRFADADHHRLGHGRQARGRRECRRARGRWRSRATRRRTRCARRSSSSSAAGKKGAEIRREVRGSTLRLGQGRRRRGAPHAARRRGRSAPRTRTARRHREADDADRDRRRRPSRWRSSRVPSVDERTAFRAICQLVGVACKSGEEAAKSSELLRVLIDLARRSGRPGAAARAAVHDRPRGAAGELAGTSA